MIVIQGDRCRDTRPADGFDRNVGCYDSGKPAQRFWGRPHRCEFAYIVSFGWWWLVDEWLWDQFPSATAPRLVTDVVDVCLGNQKQSAMPFFVSITQTLGLIDFGAGSASPHQLRGVCPFSAQHRKLRRVSDSPLAPAIVLSHAMAIDQMFAVKGQTLCKGQELCAGHSFLALPIHQDNASLKLCRAPLCSAGMRDTGQPSIVPE